GVAQLGPQLLENPPIFLRSLRAELTCEMALQICCNSVVIKQRVVYVEQEHDASRRIIALVHYSIMGNRPAFNRPNVSRVPRQNPTARKVHLFCVLDDHYDCRVRSPNSA